MVSHRKLPDPSLDNAFNLLSIGFRYTLSFEWSDLGLKYLVTVILKGLSHQNSRLVYEIFPFLKQVISVNQFSGMIVIELLL